MGQILIGEDQLALHMCCKELMYLVWKYEEKLDTIKASTQGSRTLMATYYTKIDFN